MRPDLLALTAASVAALSNLGLVKRAQREIDAGKGPRIDEADDGLVTGTFEDGIVTKVPPNVPLRDAPCTCGSATVCRHRVAVVLAYPKWHTENASPMSIANRAPKDEVWSPSCFDDEALSSLVGKRTFTKAQATAKAGIVIELEGGATPTARLPTCAVRFHVPRDLAYARCDCQVATACEHVVLASWAYRRATELPCTVELGGKATKPSSVSGLEQTMELADHVLREGVTHLGDGDKARFARVRAALAKAGLLWPAAIVDDLEMALEAYRARSARYRTADAVFYLASLEARARAATNAASALPARFVLGSDESKETALDHVRLVSLGARVEADGRKREASVYLADPDSGVVLVATRAFTPPDEKTAPEEGPALAKRFLTGKIALGALARGQLVTRTAKRHANHALSLGTSRTGQTSVAPSAGDWECLPPNLLVRELEKLKGDLGERPPRLLRPWTLAAQMKVIALSPGDVHEIAYRPGDQELVARIGEGQLFVVRRHTRTGPSALDALARALQASPRFIAGDVRFGPFGVELDPTAIVTDRVIVPDLETEPRMVESLPLLGARKDPPIRTAVALADSVLEEALHDGLDHVRKGFLERTTRAVDALHAVGLANAGKRLAKLRDEKTPRAWLDCALRVELTREASY